MKIRISRLASSPEDVSSSHTRKEALSKVIQKIVLQLADTPGVIKAVTVYEDDHNFTRLQFTDVAVNQSLDPALFTDHP